MRKAMNTPFTDEDFYLLACAFAREADHCIRGSARETAVIELRDRLHTIMTEVSALAMAHQQLKEKA